MYMYMMTAPATLALLTTFVVSGIVFTLLALVSSCLRSQRHRQHQTDSVKRSLGVKRADPEHWGTDHYCTCTGTGTGTCTCSNNLKLQLNNLQSPNNNDNNNILDDNEDDNFFTMASVLRPKKRKPTRSSGPAPTIHLARLRRHYTGVRLPADTTTNLPHAIDAWRGIPYAQTTGGAHRFRPPVPLEPYDEDQVADAFGPTCPGSSAGGAQVEGASEDCLNLNVYRPAELFSAAETTSSVKLPVVVYVHGGAFNGGMGVERDMASFVAWAMPQQGLVAVSFNYRVGALGFPSSTAAGDEGCLNLGLKDQRLLFEWVRENIGAFGGDPARVTVMGLSAGAHSVSFLGFVFCVWC